MQALDTKYLDKLVLIAEVLDTTVDYLLTGNRSDERPLHNIRLLEVWEKLNELETMLFDHYGEKFIDMHMDDCAKKQDKDDDWLLFDP